MGEAEIRMLAEMNALTTEIAAINLKAEGMRAENAQRMHLEQSMAYTDDDFMEVSRDLILMAERLRVEI